MKVKILLAFVSILIVFNKDVFAQKNPEPGTVVLNNGDSIKGFILNKDWRINPDKIVFKKTLSDQNTVYTVDQVKSFFLVKSNSWYMASKVTIDRTPNNIEELSAFKGTANVEDTLFLKVLVRGNTSLYYAYDFKQHFFIQQGNGNLQELVVQRSVMKNNQGNPAVKTFDRYKLQLNSITADCPSLKDRIKKLAYTTKSLTSFIVDYNACSAKPIQFIAKAVKAKIKLGAVLGGTATHISFKTSIPQLKNSSFKTSYTPAAGIFLNVTLPHNNETWSIYNELLYKSYNTTSTYTTENPARVTQYVSHLNMGHVKYSLGAGYTLPWNNIKPFIKIGVSASLKVNGDAYYDQISTSKSDNAVTVTKAGYNTRNYDIGYWLSAGVIKKRFGLEIRTENPGTAGLQGGIGLSVHARNNYLLLSYRFN
jgi:hypothetical protein